jgi:HPt (histidine-containing phosphotransfer) domain-containing protein
MKGDAERCLAAGMDAYLAKPLQPRELAEAIATVLPPAAPAAAPAAADRPSPVPVAAGPFDLPRLLERVGGDRRALAELVRIFRADWPKQAARLRSAIGEGDATALRAAAHALKGAVSNFAAPAATEAAFALQKMGEAGRLVGATAVLERLEREVGALVAALGDAMGPRRPGPSRERGAAQVGSFPRKAGRPRE